MSAGPPVPADDRHENPVRALLGRGSVYTLGTMIQLSAAVIVLPIATRLLGPAEYGLVVTALIVLTLMTTAAAAGLPAAITRTYFKPGPGPERALRLVTTTAAFAVAIALLAELTGPLWSQAFSSIGYDGVLRIAVWASVPAAIMMATQAVLRAREQAGLFIIVAAVSSVGGQALGVGLVAADHGAQGYVVGVGVAQVAAAAVGLVACWSPRSGVAGRALLRESLMIGLPTVPHGLAGYLLAAGDRVIIERLEGLAAVGRYQVAYAIGIIGMTVLMAVNNAWAPIVYRARDEDRWQVLADTARALWVVAATIGGCLALAGPLLLAVAAPPSYDLAALVPVLAVVAGVVGPYMLYASNAHVLFWLGRTGALAWTTPLAAGLNIALNFALIPPLGLLGAALATLAAYALQSLIIWRVARSLAVVAWAWRPIALSVLVVVAAVTAGALLPTSLAGSALRAVLIAALLATGARFARDAVRLGSATGVPPRADAPPSPTA